MGRFVKGADRSQLCFLPECLDDRVRDDNPVHVIEAFVAALDLTAPGFAGVAPAAAGRPAHHPGVLLKLYTYGDLNKVQSSRRLDTMPLSGSNPDGRFDALRSDLVSA